MLNADSKPSLKLEAIKEGLRKHGYYVWRQPISEQEHRDVASELGKILKVTDVKIDFSGKRYAQRPGEFGFHTDPKEANIVSWWCVQADEGGNAPTLLIDMADIHLSFTESELNDFEQIQAPSIEDDYIAPLAVRKEDGRLALNYMPWKITEPEEPNKARVLKKFVELISRKQVDAVIEVSLRPGECFFVDNSRMLHGRYAVLPTSIRHLKRLWIDAN